VQCCSAWLWIIPDTSQVSFGGGRWTSWVAGRWQWHYRDVIKPGQPSKQFQEPSHFRGSCMPTLWCQVLWNRWSPSFRTACGHTFHGHCNRVWLSELSQTIPQTWWVTETSDGYPCSSPLSLLLVQGNVWLQSCNTGMFYSTKLQYENYSNKSKQGSWHSQELNNFEKCIVLCSLQCFTLFSFSQRPVYLCVWTGIENVCFQSDDRNTLCYVIVRIRYSDQLLDWNIPWINVLNIFSARIHII
jgi:hypothetical protein